MFNVPMKNYVFATCKLQNVEDKAFKRIVESVSNFVVIDDMDMC